MSEQENFENLKKELYRLSEFLILSGSTEQMNFVGNTIRIMLEASGNEKAMNEMKNAIISFINKINSDEKKEIKKDANKMLLYRKADLNTINREINKHFNNPQDMFEFLMGKGIILN